MGACCSSFTTITNCRTRLWFDKKYCQLVDISDEAYQEMQQVGTYQPDNHRKTGPYVTFMDTTREIISICGKLGMTIDSRMRLVVPVEKDKAKSVYDEFGVDEDD